MKPREERIPRYAGPDTSKRSEKMTRGEIRDRFDAEVASRYSQRKPVWLMDFESIFSLVPALVGPFIEEGDTVLDLGAGTGNLSRTILEGIKGARMTLMDFSRNMLSEVDGVLADFPGRYETIASDFLEHDLGDGAYAAVVSSFAIHHCRGEEEYLGLYRKIFKSIGKRGLFVCCDVVAGGNRLLSDLNEDAWAAFMKEQGFATADVAWKKANFAVYVGVKGE
jgi:ubiquinone/menaquinone biosynthesis C-methylase UbiE